MAKQLKFIACLVLQIFLSTHAFAQDKEAQARLYYTSAEESFNTDQLKGYLDCIEYLNKAESILGNTNPKIAYLKIKAMYKANMGYYAYDLDTYLKKFFEITDVHTYPADKYSEMLKIKEDFDYAKSHTKEEYMKLYLNPLFKSSDDGRIAFAYINKDAGNLLVTETIMFELVDKDSSKVSLRLYDLSDLIFNLAEHYYLKVKDHDKAFKLYELANKKGSIDALTKLALSYLYGRGTNENCDKAKELFYKAAKAGSTEAMYEIGHQMTQGYYLFRCFKDYKRKDKDHYLEAEQFLLKAAEHNDDLWGIEAMKDLSDLYDCKPCKVYNQTKSYEWKDKYEKAKAKYFGR